MTNNFCMVCGATLDKAANFCSRCGHQQATDPAHQPIEHQASQQQLQHQQPQQNSHQQNAAHSTQTSHYNAPSSFAESFKNKSHHSDVITLDSSNGEPVVKTRKLHPNTVWLFFLQYLAKSAVLLLLFSIVVFIEPLWAAALIVPYLLGLYIAAVINYNNFEFEVSAVSFRKTYGVFHKYSVNIAFDQIQNINMRRSVIDQILGLAHLEIETAGSDGNVKRYVSGLMTTSEGYIPGITTNEAKDIKALMLARVNN